jgi:uncharacterized protein (TIGR03437 family)
MPVPGRAHAGSLHPPRRPSFPFKFSVVLKFFADTKSRPLLENFSVKHAFRTLLALAFVCSAAAASALAQTPTPDPLIMQITRGTSGNTFARDISGDGRFVVIESTGDIATVPPGQTAANKSPNNADGNLEIFLFDYAQRRIFQITDTRSQLVDPNAAAASRFNRENIRVNVANTRPAISRDGRFVIFGSNAFDPADASSSPFSFDGNAAGTAERLRGDANMELFVYRIPDVPAADLTSGETPAFVDLRQNAFTRVTNTAASLPPRAGGVLLDPFVADDNRAAQVNDDGSRVVFISTRNLAPAAGRNNADGSPEVFAFTNGTLVQLTDITQAAFNANPLAFIDNPNISGATTGDSVVAFLSNATDLRAGDGSTNLAAANADGNAEVFVATFNGAALANVRQATRTRRGVPQDIVNVLSPGRRLSRSGQLLAFESVANDPKADSSTNDPNRGLFVYNVAADTFTQVTSRAVSGEVDSVFRFPTFTGDNARLVWVSDLNLTPAGARVARDDTTGLNPTNAKQIFSAPVPPAAVAVSRLTNTPTAGGNTLEPFVSNTQERISFSLAGVDFGAGNTNQANEAFYLLVPPANVASDTPAASSALAYFTGATRIAVGAPTAATPTPTPAPVTGLAPGMIGVVARTAQSPALAAATRRACPADNPGCDAASESMRRPPLPVELGGVSVSVNGAAAGLYFVSAEEIQFVVPAGLAPQTGTSTYPVVITIRDGGTVRTVRSTLQVTGAQPDIFSTTNGPGGRAVVTNVTNPLLSTGTPEPFTVTTTYANAQGQNVTEATRLRLVLTGVRNVARTNIVVRLIKADGTATDVGSGGDPPGIPTDPQPTDMPGVFTLDFRLPASLAGAGDVRVVVLATSGTATFASRPADTAPSFRIN